MGHDRGRVSTGKRRGFTTEPWPLHHLEIRRSEKGEGSSKMAGEEVACGVGEKSGKFDLPEDK